jgi:hypothetical protein
MALLIGMPSGDLSGPGQRAGCGAWCRWLGYGVTCSANRDNAAPWRPPSFPPGQPGHLEDPDSTIHVRKTVTMIAEDDPYRLVTCGSVVMAAGGRLHRPRVRSQAARRARLCGHGRHGGFRADRGGRPRLDAAQLTYRVDFWRRRAGSASRGYRRILVMRWSNELRTLPTCRGTWLCCRLVMTRPSARRCPVPGVGSCRPMSTSRPG